MDITKCRAFITAVEQGSITAAAETMGYTQSGLTRMINSLEEELGFPLLRRSKKGVTLTENGQLMIVPMREMIRACNRVLETGAVIRGVVTGVISVGIYFSASTIIMPSILKRFEELYPDVRVRLQEGGNTDMKRWLKGKSVDLCFCAEPSSDTECDWIPLFKDKMVAWLPKGHPKAGQKVFPVKDIEKEPFIHTLPNHDTDQDRLLREENLHPEVRYTTKDGFSTYNMVAAGLGISFNQSIISRKWKDDIALVPLQPARYVSMGIAVPSLKELSPAAKRFMECIQQVTKELGYHMPSEKQ